VLVIFIPSVAPESGWNFEIDDLHVVPTPGLLLQDEEVVRLQIAMKDSGGVGRAEALQHLQYQRREIPRGHARETLEPPRKRFPVEELEHHVLRAVLECAEIQHLEDVIVADTTCGLRFPLKARDHSSVRRVCRMHDLDRDAALNANVLAFVDRAHPARADEALDAVLAIKDLPGF
jgi:hypothetical protein